MATIFSRILCATDFSETSERALDYAFELARLGDATVVLVHILSVAQGDFTDERGVKMDGETATRRALERLEKLYASRRADHSKCELVVDIGPPGERLVGVAQERKVDLVVTATRGHSQIADLLIGSVAETLIHKAPCPVLVIRTTAA